MNNDDVIVEIQCAVCGKRSKVNTTHPCDNCNATKCYACCRTSADSLYNYYVSMRCTKND